MNAFKIFMSQKPQLR